MRKYIDKNNREIKAGDMISIERSKPTKVYAIQTDVGTQGLGISASNPKYLKAHPEQDEQFYPLTEFSHVSTLGGIVQMTSTVIVGSENGKE